MKRYGFNFQWFLHYNEKGPQILDTRPLDFMKANTFNFVRIPVDYRFFIKNFDYYNPCEESMKIIDQYLGTCWERNLHVNLNLHRAPGYCIMNNDWEKDNLWLDEHAQDAFAFVWEYLATRYKNISDDLLSFDLINEPPNINQYGCSRERHAEVIRKGYAAIKKVSPTRVIYIDGLDGGNTALPELADLDVIMSCRGYQPMGLTHYNARWWNENEDLPVPTYPKYEWNNITWNKDTLKSFYAPWLEVSKKRQIHVGEFGCYSATPNNVALRWFSDVLSIYKEFGWSYSLWEFDGTFGVAYHGRPGANYINYKGLYIDNELVRLLLDHRT